MMKPMTPAWLMALTITSAGMFSALPALPALAEDWGTLTGKFVLDGAAPTPTAIKVTKDEEVCGKHNLVIESLLVDPDGGIANVVVYLSVPRGGKAPTVHAIYEANQAAEVELDNLNCRFEPHVAILRTTQTLNIGNSDPVGHNTKIDTVKNSPINPIIPANSNLQHKFAKPEGRPSPVSCSIHPWMKGFVLIIDHPYAAVSGEDGMFSIENIPAGKWEFQVWHEKSNYLTSVVRDGKSEKWKKGTFEFEIKPGANDLGEVKVALKDFKN